MLVAVGRGVCERMRECVRVAVRVEECVLDADWRDREAVAVADNVVRDRVADGVRAAERVSECVRAAVCVSECVGRAVLVSECVGRAVPVWLCVGRAEPVLLCVGTAVLV